MRQKDKIENMRRVILSLAALSIFLCFALAFETFIHDLGRLCEKWGGQLYEDNNCYLTKDMTKCITETGRIKENRILTHNIYNFNETNQSLRGLNAN